MVAVVEVGKKVEVVAMMEGHTIVKEWGVVEVDAMMARGPDDRGWGSEGIFNSERRCRRAVGAMVKGLQR